MGVLAKIDRATLATYCSVWAKWVAVSRLLDTGKPSGNSAGGSLTVPDPTHPDRPAGGIRKNPLWSVYFGLGAQLLTLAKELGLTPNTRARMTVPESDDSDPDGILD